jgi:hypothetical protein
MEVSGVQTYQELLRDGANRLREAGIEEAGHEVRLMLMAASSLSRTGLISAEPDAVPDEVAVRFTRCSVSGRHGNRSSTFSARPSSMVSNSFAMGAR